MESGKISQKYLAFELLKVKQKGKIVLYFNSCRTELL